MKKKIYLLALFLLPFCSFYASAQNMDVYLLIGQSNMAGRGDLMEEDLGLIEGVWLLNVDGQIEQASNPMNKYSTIRGPLKAQKMSPAYSFAKRLHRVTGKEILLVVNAKGGSSIEEWLKGNEKTHYFDEAVRRTKESLKYGNLKAIIWHQGERNSAEPDDYLIKLDKFVSDLRNELGNNSIPFIAGEIAQWHKNAKKMNPKIQSIPSLISNSAYVTSVGAQPLKGDNDPHFNRRGNMLLGERYAKKILEIVYDINIK